MLVNVREAHVKSKQEMCMQRKEKTQKSCEMTVNQEIKHTQKSVVKLGA